MTDVRGEGRRTWEQSIGFYFQLGTPWLISSELFFALIEAHECLDLDCTALQEADCDRAMMVILKKIHIQIFIGIFS